MTGFRTSVLFLVWIAVGPHLLLADTLYHAAGDPPRGIDMYDPLSGAYLGSFGHEELANPWGVNFAPDGSLYVSDWGRNVIEQYDPATGERLRTVAAAQRPLALLVRSNGNLLVCQELEDNIAEYDAQGTLLRTFGVCGTDLEIGPDGLLYVA